MKKWIIMCAFPMTGKTYAGNKYQNICDLGRTRFKHLLSENGWQNAIEQQKWEKRPINPERPNNYKEAIVEALHHYDVVLVNEAILETLRNNNIPYSCVVPVVSCKKEYMERMKSRGNNEQFIQKMAEHFEEYITNNAQDEYAENIYTLQQGQYLSDLLKTLDIPLIEKIAI